MIRHDLKYTDFRKASYRNLNVSKELIRILDSCDPINKKGILHKVFYLSGYIIEFSYKYALFHHLGLSKTTNVYKHGNDDFKKKWKEHNFSKLRSLCSEHNLNFSTDIPHFGSKIENKDVEKLLNSWDVQIRYDLSLSKNSIILEEEQIKKFVDNIEEILNKITTNFS